MVLNTQPTADVTIALSSSDTTEGTVGPASLTFTTANWNVAQTVTVTGVDDAAGRRRRRVHDRDGGGGEHRPELQRRQRGRRGGEQHRQRRAGITVTPTAGLMTTEAGGTATFTVVLNTQPTADVTIALSSSDTTEGTVAPGEPDLHDRELEHGADGDGDRRGRRASSTATSRTRS